MDDKYSFQKLVHLNLHFDQTIILTSIYPAWNNWEEIENPNFTISISFPKPGYGRHEIGMLFGHDGGGKWQSPVLVTQGIADAVFHYLQSQYQKLADHPLGRITKYPDQFGDIDSIVMNERPLFKIHNLQINGTPNNYFVLTPLDESVNLKEFYETIGN